MYLCGGALSFPFSSMPMWVNNDHFTCRAYTGLRRMNLCLLVTSIASMEQVNLGNTQGSQSRSVDLNASHNGPCHLFIKVHYLFHLENRILKSRGTLNPATEPCNEGWLLYGLGLLICGLN